MKHLLPEGWPAPKGYANGIMAGGTPVFVAGMIGWDRDGKFPAGFVDQFSLVLENTVAVLAAAGASPGHIVRMTWFVKDMDAYRGNLKAVGRVYRAIVGRHYPAMAVIGVDDLVQTEALLEIETTAMIPPPVPACQ